MNIVFQINGGIGKCVVATAVCKAIKTKYPESKLIVISGYPDVFINNPNVHRSYSFGNMSYFYEHYIENQEFMVFAHDPYFDTEHLKRNEHLIQTWCRIYGIPYNNEKPEIFLTDRERKFYGNKFSSEKPIFIMQTNGGGDTNIKYSWARDIPQLLAAQVVAKYKSEYNIIHIRRDDQLSIDSTFHIQDNFRAIAVLIEKSQKRLFMDSFCQHTASALNKPSSVLWIANNPKVFGYNLNDNIQSNPFTKQAELKNSVYSKFNIAGDPIEFPYNSEDEMFDLERILSSLESQ